MSKTGQQACRKGSSIRSGREEAPDSLSIRALAIRLPNTVSVGRMQGRAITNRAGRGWSPGPERRRSSGRCQGGPGLPLQPFHVARVRASVLRTVRLLASAWREIEEHEATLDAARCG